MKAVASLFAAVALIAPLALAEEAPPAAAPEQPAKETPAPAPANLVTLTLEDAPAPEAKPEAKPEAPANRVSSIVMEEEPKKEDPKKECPDCPKCPEKK